MIVIGKSSDVVLLAVYALKLRSVNKARGDELAAGPRLFSLAVRPAFSGLDRVARLIRTAEITSEVHRPRLLAVVEAVVLSYHGSPVDGGVDDFLRSELLLAYLEGLLSRHALYSAAVAGKLDIVSTFLCFHGEIRLFRFRQERNTIVNLVAGKRVIRLP